MPRMQLNYRAGTMNRFGIVLSITLLLISAFPQAYLEAGPQNRTLLHIRAPAEGPTERVYFHSASGDVEALLALRRHLIEEGARNVNCFVPFTVVCELPADVSYREFLAHTDIVLLHEADVAQADAREFVFGPKWTKLCYEMSDQMATGKYREESVKESLDRFVMPDISLPSRPAGPASVSPSSTEERLYFQDSEFMIGDILALLVYPESDGTQENWTDGQLSQAASGTVLAMMYYQETFPHVPIDFVFRSFPRTPTTTEPINFSREEGSPWITDVMNNLGYPGAESDYLQLVHQFNDDWRNEWKTDWVFTAFIANSTNDEDNRFGTRVVKELYLGFAQLGGPYMALPFPTGEPGVYALKGVFMHELGHVFWGLQEHMGYNDANCDSRSGYLNYQNYNRTVSVDPIGGAKGCASSYHPVPCVMNLGNAYYGYEGLPCKYTIGMLGLADVNDNRVPDAVDAAPIVVFQNSDLETTLTDSFHLRLQAISGAVANRNPVQPASRRRSYALPIKDVSYIVNGVGPIWMYPDDGVYDEDIEDIEVVLSDLIPGYSKVEVKTRNTLGATSESYVKGIYYVGLNFIHFSFSYLNEGVGISWNLLGETFHADLNLHRKLTGPAPGDSIIASHVTPAGPSSGYFTPYYIFDGSADPGRKYLYYVEGTFTVPYHGRDTTLTSRSRDFEVTASLHMTGQSIISAPSPNPFRDHTCISIRVPASTEEAGTGNSKTAWPAGSAPNAPVVYHDVPTSVIVTIYNALGHPVKRLYNGWSYATVLTIDWDGTNDNGDRIPSGVYFLRAKAGPYTQVQKVLVMR